MPAKQRNADLTTKYPITIVIVCAMFTKLVRTNHKRNALHLQLRPSNLEADPSSSPYQTADSLQTFINI